ncbi:MAG: ribosome recycling factor [Bdellovibrionales bacterium]|nr:ribosome recycling factor [Bdellovibrionales bacterium]
MEQEIKNLIEQCKGSIEHFSAELGKIRGGKANTALLEGVTVEYYGTQTPLKQLGLVTAPEAQTLAIQVYDQGAVDAVEKAIRQADLGLNPSRDGNIVRVNVPALTEERRKEFIKKLHKMAEDARVAIRSHRKDANDQLKKRNKDKEISDDDLHKLTDDVQSEVNSAIEKIDTMLAEKEKEMLVV